MAKNFKFNFIHDFFEKGEDKFEWDTHFRKTRKGQPPVYRKSKKTKGGIRFFGGSRKTFSQKQYQESQQLCILKAKYRYNKELNLKHLNYIKREGTGIHGEDPYVYGADPEHYEQRMAKLHFRFIISPENQKVDLEALTREFIKRIEFRYGLRLDWVAADHYNTGNKHTHLLVNGFDLNRKKVFFKSQDIRSILRETLRTICTEQVGYRSIAERHAASLRQTISNSYTMLDRKLEHIMAVNHTVSFHKAVQSQDDSLLHKRIIHLKSLGLVSYDSHTAEFKFNTDWKDRLKLFGSYNTFLDGLAFTQAHPSNYILHKVDNLGTISGTIVKRYFMQDNSNNHAVILETSPGKFAYVPLYEAPTIAVGQNVKIEFQQLHNQQKGSKTIVTHIT